MLIPNSNLLKVKFLKFFNILLLLIGLNPLWGIGPVLFLFIILVCFPYLFLSKFAILLKEIKLPLDILKTPLVVFFYT